MRNTQDDTRQDHAIGLGLEGDFSTFSRSKFFF